MLSKSLAALAIVGLVAGCATIQETATVTRDPISGEIFVDWSRQINAMIGGKADKIAQERSGSVSYIDANGKEIHVEFFSGQNVEGLTSPDVSVALVEGVSKAILGGMAMQNQARAQEREFRAANPSPSSPEMTVTEELLSRLGPLEH